jgi:sortase A
LAAAVVPPALFVYGVLAVARDYAEAKAARRRAAVRTRARAPQARSDDRTRARPASHPHPAVDLKRALPVAPEPGDDRTPNSGRRRKRLAIVLIVVGAVLGAYAAAVVLWRDPVTDVYARWKQAQAEEALGATFAEFDDVLAPTAIGSNGGALAADPNAFAVEGSAAVAEAAEKMMARVRLGQPIGRIAIPRIGVKAVFIHGTRWGPDLSRGPGHYKETELPGVGRTAAIAAHRTTFGAWFRNIDDLRSGNRITLSLPYATFDYKVFMHKIVDDEDWSIIEDRGFDALVLSACHPLYSAKQRWVVFARLTTVKPRGGEPYAVTSDGRPVALGSA